MGWAYCPLNLIDSGRGLEPRKKADDSKPKHSQCAPQGA